MSPANLPNGPLVRLKRRQSTLLSVIAHTANLQEAFAVTAGDLGAIVVKLAIVYVVLVLCVHAEYIIVALGLRCLLTAVKGLLGHLLSVYLLLGCHALYLLTLWLRRCTKPTWSITLKSLTHFFFRVNIKFF